MSGIYEKNQMHKMPFIIEVPQTREGMEKKQIFEEIIDAISPNMVQDCTDSKRSQDTKQNQYKESHIYAHHRQTMVKRKS